mmetsp:Transcript_10359/g.15004  ORF Transcript_10359/g.15004 Transcript_10359/m.15004 type:complete len:170 (-) Transcript_10359:81-590(-)
MKLASVCAALLGSVTASLQLSSSGNSTTNSSLLQFDANAAANWALNCWNGCSQCECNHDTVHGDNTGWCSHPAGCGCTPFVSHALILGGGWKHAEEDNCLNLWNNVLKDPSSNWSPVSHIAPGDVVVMDCEGPATHCCIGTGPDVVSCHNKNSKNVAPPCKADGIYRHK